MIEYSNLASNAAKGPLVNANNDNGGCFFYYLAHIYTFMITFFIYLFIFKIFLKNLFIPNQLIKKKKFFFNCGTQVKEHLEWGGGGGGILKFGQE